MTINRVTQSMLTDRSLAGLQTGLGRLSAIQERLSTGRVLNRPSDSPTDTAAAMRLRATITAQQQYTRNAEDGLGWLNTADATLQDVNDQLRRARELGLQGMNGAIGAESREALATELEQIRASLVAAGNTTYLDRPVFGGTTPGAVAYTSGTTVAFAGDGNPVNRTIADGVTIAVNVAGPDVFGPDGDSVFAHIDDLVTSLRANDGAGISAGVGALAGDMERVTATLSDIGARTLRAENAAQRGKDAELGLTNSLSEIENADLPKTMVELQMQEVAYQAALAATARVLQPSLVDFLR